MDLSPILGKIEAVRARVRQLVTLDGICRVALVLLAAALFSFCIDYFIPKVPFAVRLTVLAAGLGAVAVAAWRFVVVPLAIPLSDDDLALCVEQQYPDLHDRLISAIQLSRQRGEFARFNSPELVDALVKEAMGEADRLDFSPVVVPAGPMKMAAGTAAALVVAAGLAVWQVDAVKTWLGRLLSDTVQWPKQTQIVVLEPAGSEVTVAKGDDLRVEVETRGKQPRKAVIHYVFSGQGEGISRPMRSETGNRWVFEFTKVIEPMQFWIEAGDDETDRVIVQVLNPPTVERITLLYDYPDYTQLKDTDPTSPVEDGNIIAPPGTKVTVTAQANLDIAKAKAMFGRRGEEDVRELAVRNDAQGRPRLVVAPVEVLTNTQYAIWLQAVNGLQTASPVRYSIKAIEDKPPEIRVSEPNLDKFCTATARIPIRLATTDDFGVTKLELLIRVQNDPKREATVALDAYNTESYPAKRIDTEFWFDMAEFGAKEGMVIQYQLVARDGREIPKANETKTRVFQFTVVKRDDLLRKMEDRLARIREELQRVIQFQESGRSDSARLMDAVGAKDILSAIERQEVNGAAGNQRRITQHMERITHEFDEIVRDMRYNKLLEGGSEARLKRPGDLLHGVTEQKSPEAAATLASSGSVGQAKERMGRLQDAAIRQEDILTDLNTILGLLTEYETYLEVVRYVRELLQKAKGNLEDMRRSK
ncbi:MAG: hypothetical protein IT452_09160 [Planctomycetia bacterium]|nr:hypothetical protein [Planctomycetia bacterium]